MMDKALVVYVSQPAAPLCERVCDFLDSRGYRYEKIDVANDDDREAMRQRTGYTSCPLVMVGEQVVGKLEDAVEADRSGRLNELLST